MVRKNPRGCLPEGQPFPEGHSLSLYSAGPRIPPSASSGGFRHRSEAVDARPVPDLDRVVTGHARVEELPSTLVDDGVGGDASTLSADHAVVAVAVASDGNEGRATVSVARVDLHVAIVVCLELSVKRPCRNPCGQRTLPQTQGHRRRTRRPGSQQRHRRTGAREGSYHRSSRRQSQGRSRSSCPYNSTPWSACNYKPQKTNRRKSLCTKGLGASRRPCQNGRVTSCYDHLMQQQRKEPKNKQR